MNAQLHVTHLAHDPCRVLAAQSPPQENDRDYGRPRPGPSDAFSKIPCFHSFFIHYLIPLFNLKNTEELITIFSRKRTISLLFGQLMHVQTGFLYLLVMTAVANNLLC